MCVAAGDKVNYLVLCLDVLPEEGEWPPLAALPRAVDPSYIRDTQIIKHMVRYTYQCKRQKDS